MEKYLKGKKSILWNFFTPKNEILASCNLCKQTLSYKSTISNLKMHLRKKHPTIKISNENQTEEIQSQIPNPHSTVDTELPDENNETEPTDFSEPSTSSSCKVVSAKPKLHQTRILMQKKVGFSQKNKLMKRYCNLSLKIFSHFQLLKIKVLKIIAKL